MGGVGTLVWRKLECVFWIPLIVTWLLDWAALEVNDVSDDVSADLCPIGTNIDFECDVGGGEGTSLALQTLTIFPVSGQLLLLT